MAETEMQTARAEIQQLVVAETKERKQIDCCLLFLTFIQYSFYASAFLYCYIGCPILIYLGARGGIIGDRLFESAIYITVIAYVTLSINKLTTLPFFLKLRILN